MKQKQRCIVHCQGATYSGTIAVYADPDEENNIIENRARNEVRRMAGGSLPFGYQTFKVISRKECSDA